MGLAATARMGVAWVGSAVVAKSSLGITSKGLALRW